MLEKMRKNRKVIVVIIIMVVVLLGIIFALPLNKKNVATNVETKTEENKIKSLASKAGYKVFSLKEKNFILIIQEDSLEEEEFKDFIKKVYEYGSEFGEESISFQVFSEEQYAKNLQEFYGEGLLKNVEINVKDHKAVIGSFEKVPFVEASEFINEYTEGKIGYENGQVTITMDMVFEEENQNLTSVVANAKAFCNLFKAANPSKDIKSIELHLNENSDKNQYRFNDSFEEVLERMETVVY